MPLHGRGRDDPAYVAGCGFRAVACLNQSLFALNGVYLLNEKGATAAAEKLPRHPPDLCRAGRGGRSRRGAAGLPRLMALVEETG